MLGLVSALTLLVAPTLFSVGAGAPAAAAAAPTVVSLTFDDGNADATVAAQTLQANGLRGTFFVPSGYVDQPGYLTQADLRGIAAGGHEIGGHSVTHPDLTAMSRDEATRQICNDRANLTGWGFDVTSFAYPFASATADTEALARQCGYNSARGLGDVETRFGCEGCDRAEAVPPQNPFYTKAPDQVDSTWTLADLQNVVTAAENDGGGWIQLTFHHVCAGNCDPAGLSVSPELLDEFAGWLAARAADNTSVKTVREVIGGPVAPATPGPVAPVAAPGVNGAPNPGLEAVGANGLPTCWMAGGYGVNSPTFATVPEARSGSVAARLSMTGYVDGDAKLLPTLDLGECSPGAVPGHTYALSAWYKSTAPTQFAVYYRTAVGTWAYWTSSPWFDVASEYTAAEWTTPAVPAGATGISFGLNLFGDGELHTDDYSITDTSAGSPQPPTGSWGLGSTGTAPGDGTTAPERGMKSIPDTDRSDRRGQVAPQLHYVPGPEELQPGQTFLPNTGPLAD
ncbi:polysaccharide deacetylase family protein [Prescottella defluvii]|uniref:polysaccharide deacetylase family protein n=1 Tax=Prescottella defluvii TaxID=1323361 RepID=UPI0006901E04|nr:polysaccharide deacetylase family protein [Prescottella defluvii]